MLCHSDKIHLSPQNQIPMNEPPANIKHLNCERGEGVQGVLTLFCSGAAQVCYDDRVVELKEQLEVEEVDGDRQEEKVEVQREKSSQKGCAHVDDHGWSVKIAQNWSQGM